MNKQVKTFIITFLIALPVFFFSFKYFNGDFDDDPAPVSGCIDELAYNYNKEATVDDGSCIDIVKGCIDPTSFNYNDQANTDDGSCIDIVKGCTDQNAINYNPEANTDDGSCKIDPLSTIEGTKDCLLQDNADWCYPSCKSPIAAYKFLKNGTFSCSSTTLGGVHNGGEWEVIEPGKVRLIYTHSAYGIFHNINSCSSDLPVPSNQTWNMLECYKLMNGSTPYLRD